jgi:hypothetical protein
MADGPWKLPQGVTVPRQYEKSIRKQQWFIEGAQDGARGRTETDFQTLASRQGVGIAEAYRAGYKAGKVVAKRS